MTGFIGVGQLRYILTNLGEKMSDDEVDELLKAVDTTSGEINYVGMCIPALPSCNRMSLRQWTLTDRPSDLVKTILAN